jgi:diguanylate cyclase (GGDEF)-like protein
VIANSILAQKLTTHCKQNRPVPTSLAACCKEILQNFKFDCVFLAHALTPEEIPTSLAFDGKEEVMDAALYRLGVEERVSLVKLPVKAYSDITGKPVFNKSGSLRIQKPNSGIFFTLYKPKEYFILFGCGHQDSRSYERKELEELSEIWKSWNPVLPETIKKIGVSVKSDPLPPPSAPKAEPAIPVSKAEAEPVSKVSPEPPAKAEKKEKSDEHRRPVILVDEVTRLFNKDYFEECLAIEVERAKRYSRQVSLLFLSVTPIDKSLSMDEDRVATQVADILFKSLRRVDIICRLDKHKYGIILPDTDNNTYGIIAKRVFKFYKQIMGEAPPVFLNISASTYPKHAGNHLLLLENAEKLLVQAQEVGPNKAVLPE